MTRLEDLQARITDQGQFAIDYAVEWIKWSTNKNFDVAGDFAEFTIEQLRLPVAAEGFSEYSDELRESYSRFGEVLKRHGDDYATRLKDVPANILEVFAPKKTRAKEAA